MLEEASGNLALGVYIKLRLFTDMPAVPRQNSISRVDKKALGKVLGALGASDLAPNMRTIAEAASSGSMPVSDSLVEELHMACREISALREAVMRCIGYRGSQ
ncbi:MAG: hypothetical protein AAFN91_00825 [Pseudomonadota bacterium]